LAFPDAWLDELLAKNDIVSVISSYVELRPKGRRLWGLCPLHGEKTPSFSVSPDKQMFYCFGCHAGGTVIQFIMQMERLSFVEAVKLLANRAGMELPENADDTAMQRERAYKERLYAACKAAARFYMETLLGPDGAPGRAYLAGRGLTSESVKRFGIGYAPAAWDALKNHLLAAGFTQQELLDAGLLVHNTEKNSVYDAYRNRVIFPIIGASGRVLGFGARVLNDDKPKYINTGDTPIYNKRNNLYGLYLQKGRRCADLVMVEGYTDVIGLFEAGITNAVASLGTALTVQQARLLKRYTQLVYIAYDGDAAGQNATIRGLDILSHEGIDVRVIVFPDAQDPDEFIRTHGREAFDALKDHALSLNAFKLESMARGYRLTDENNRERYAKEACRFIASLQPVEQGRYYAQLAKKTGYPVEALQAQGAAGSPLETAPVRRSPGIRRTAVPVEEDARTRAENALLLAMAQSREATLAAVSDGAAELFSDDARSLLAAEIIAAYAADTAPNCARIIAAMPEELAGRLAGVFREDAVAKDPLRVVRDCAAAIRRFDRRRQIDAMTLQLTDSTLPANERQALMEQIQHLTRELRG
jgi:DNA primase